MQNTHNQTQKEIISSLTTKQINNLNQRFIGMENTKDCFSDKFEKIYGINSELERLV